jgi:hypothetical protein
MQPLLPFPRRALASPTLLALGLSALAGSAGCSGCEGCSAPATLATPSGVASGSTSGAAPRDEPPPWVGIPQPVASVGKVVNPKGAAPYAGPTGTVKGVVRFEGDPAPEVPLRVPSKCGEARAVYGKKFRVGPDGGLADVLVAVTGYDGFVPARGPAARVAIHGCALDKRTIAVAFGQRVEVSNLDAMESYMPYLDGEVTRAQLVAVPRGDAVKLYPHAPGRYVLRDSLPHDWMTAEVLALAYATHDVTTLTGAFEIPGVPVGKVRLSAVLPATGSSHEKNLEVKPGDNVVELTLRWTDKGSPAVSSSASAAPASSAPAPK